jgi:hypothetical protein
VSGRDLTHDGQTYATSLSLRRKERHKYPLALIRRDTGTVIRDRNGDVPVWIAPRRQSNATFRHVAQCLYRVSYQIDESLIQQIHIDGQLQRFRLYVRGHLNVTGRQVTRQQPL